MLYYLIGVLACVISLVHVCTLLCGPPPWEGAAYCVALCLSARLSVRPVIVTERHVAPPSELQWHTCTFRHTLRAAYRTAISAVQILVLVCIPAWQCRHVLCSLWLFFVNVVADATVHSRNGYIVVAWREELVEGYEEDMNSVGVGLTKENSQSRNKGLGNQGWAIDLPMLLKDGH